MENKTIRVWNREINTCAICPLFHYDDYGTNNCSEIEINYNTRVSKEIDKNCPFAKPLSKEDIESCGFVFEEQIVGVVKYTYKTTGLIELYTKHNGRITILNNGINAFDGTINNLPEFKLLLKQLNIE